MRLDAQPQNDNNNGVGSDANINQASNLLNALVFLDEKSMCLVYVVEVWQCYFYPTLSEAI